MITDSVLHPQVHAAVERLYTRVRQTGHCDVLIDPKADWPFKEEIEKLDPKLVPRMHLRDPMFAQVPEQAPVLIRLPVDELALIDALVAHAWKEATAGTSSTRGVCAFIDSAEPHATVANQLTWALDLRVEWERIYFRYFDPRVFTHLPHLLPTDKLADLLRRITSWAFFERDGTFVLRDVPVGEISSLNFSLSSEQWQRFELIAAFNAACKLLADLGQPCNPKNSRELFDEVERAARNGLAQRTDISSYVALVRTQGVRLSEHPRWPALLALIESGVPLQDAAKHLCDATLWPAAIEDEQLNT